MELCLCELEECLMKVKMELMGEDLKQKGKEKEDTAYRNKSLLFTKELEEELEEASHLLDAKARFVFDREGAIFDYAKRHATDLKGNSRVFFTKKNKIHKLEAIFEMLRLDLIGTFKQYTDENCGKGGGYKKVTYQNHN